MSSVTQSPAWKSIARHHQTLQSLHMRDLFAIDPHRATTFCLEAAGVFLDFSKHRITCETMDHLLGLAHQQQVPTWIKKMFSGEAINNTEQRAVLHTALRNRSQEPCYVKGENITPAIRAVLTQMEHFVQRVHSGDWRGYTGETITDVVHIGIGGSGLGPRMVTTALRPYAIPHIRCHFVSNVDGADLAGTLAALDHRRTLFIIASKTFGTQETLLNAHSARQWFLDQGASTDSIAKHFVAVSTQSDAVRAFGIDPHNMFIFWDWVGGRYALWSAIGLPIALAIGMPNFMALLEGASQMDTHFRTAPLSANMPVIMAMLGILYINFFGVRSHVIAPYAQCLQYLPEYLQQVDMESNGKGVTRFGDVVDYDTSPVIWGTPGTNGQHAFFQQLHQGPAWSPVDFIVPMVSSDPLPHHHDVLVAHCFAQSQALMRGQTERDVVIDIATHQGHDDAKRVQALLPHRLCPGNRPSSTIVLNAITPKTLGALLALYEHKVFVQSIIWDINAFDQWGVELGKQLAGRILASFDTASESFKPTDTIAHDSSTQHLIARYRAARAG